MSVNLINSKYKPPSNNKYNNTVFINGKCKSIDRLNKNKRTRDFIEDII